MLLAQLRLNTNYLLVISVLLCDDHLDDKLTFTDHITRDVKPFFRWNRPTFECGRAASSTSGR